MLEIPKQDTVSLYRIENPTIQAAPNGVTSHEDLIGQWFSPDLDSALLYLRKSTQTSGKNVSPVEGAQLVIAHINPEKLDSFNVAHHPIASGMDVESDNFLIPRDGSVATDIIPLDEILSDLSGRLGNLKNYQDAAGRVHALLGSSALIK